jgi:tetratricopeptide (TPR) repeat protein
MRRILLAVMLTSALPGAAPAQSLAQQWAWCHDDDSDRLIRGCTAIIRSGHESPDDISRAYFNRGRAWSDKGEFDRAIQDFNEAIRLDPNYADAFNNRGVAYAGKGDSSQAIADFDRAIQLDPNYAIAIFNRGLALQNLGRSAEAEQAFARARQAGPRLLPPKE